MLTELATDEMILEWKEIYRLNKPKLKPNKLNIDDVKQYLENKYTMIDLDSTEFNSIIKANIMSNPHYSERIQEGISLDIESYVINKTPRSNHLFDSRKALFKNMRIKIGFERMTNRIQVFGSDILSDELIAFQGLDEYDLENFYIVAEYINCLTKSNLLGETIK